jgi:hypothetical protein
MFSAWVISRFAMGSGGMRLASRCLSLGPCEKALLDAFGVIAYVPSALEKFEGSAVK